MPQINLTADDTLTARVDERSRPHYHGGRGWVARRDLERYYALVERELRTLALGEAEVHLLMDATNGVLHEAWSIPYLAAGVEDAIRLDSLDEKWQVDGPALVAKLHALTPGQAYALIDALERVWQQDGDLHERLVAVGLLACA